MNMRRMVKSFVEVAFMGVTVVPTMADTWTDGNGVAWTYTVSGGTAVLGGGGYYSNRAVPADTAGDLVIPSELGGCPVVGINAWAFNRCDNLTSVTIPDSVKYINDAAFCGCQISEVNIGTNVQSIGQMCFNGCSRLTHLTIPDSVTSIGAGAFSYCSSLRELTIGNGLTTIDYDTGGSVLSALGGITMNVVVNPFGGLFNLAGVEFGTAIEKVNWNVFAGCYNLKYVYFHGGLPTRFGSMPGASNRAVYVTHEAYPDGLPNSTWEDAPIKYFEGQLPSEGKWWDMEFYRPDGWPASFFLSASSNSFVACDRFLEGDAVYSSFAYADLWGIMDIPQQFACTLHVDNSIYGGFVWADALKVAEYGSNEFIVWECLTNLPPGKYTATWELNAPIDWLPGKPRTFGETDFSNNSNTVAFTVVPAVEITFVSEGNAIAAKKYEIGDSYGTFPPNPIREGFSFAGWFTEEDGGTVVTTDAKVPSTPTTLYAHWELAINETVPVGGVLLSGHATWRFGNVYEVTSDYVVSADASLTIEPGTIVKFDAGKSLFVNGGATLSAIGTRGLPIIFTSIKDDASGGDTNGDGDATTPQAGDWVKICINGGTAAFDHAKILYSSHDSMTGAINVNGGTVTFTNGEIAHGAYDAIGVEYGHCHVRNTVITDCLLAFRHWTTDPIENCVIYDCGRLTQGGGQHFYNCIFSKITETWEAFGFPQNGTTYRNCCFWNEDGSILTAEGRQDAKTVCGKNGNIWADPLFACPEKGDFRIAANSPCVDAGDGAYAPEKDYYGKPRMNVDAIRPTGTAAANGAVPDIGIYEVPGDGIIPSVDLTVTSVTAPATLTIGETVEVSWKVKNVGEESVSGMWRDDIEIVAVNGQTFSMGTVTSQAKINPGASANFKARLTVPAAPEGIVQVRVTANKHQDIFESMRSENNAGFAAATLVVPTLAVPADGTATTVTLGGGSDIGFVLDGGGALAEHGGVLVIRGAGELDAWLGTGAIAAKDTAIRTAVKIAEDTWMLQIPADTESHVTLCNDGEGSVSVSLSLEVGKLLVLDAVITKYDSPAAEDSLAATSSKRQKLQYATVTAWGNGFGGSVSCRLEVDGEVHLPVEIVADGEMTLCATFNLPERLWVIMPDSNTNQTPVYVLYVKNGDQERSIEARRRSGDAGGGGWYGTVDVPDVIRSGRSYVGTFRYGNHGSGGVQAPYVSLTAKGDTLIRLSESDAWSKSVSFMAASDTYPASVLKAGDSSTMTFLYKTTGQKAEIEYALTQASDVDVPWDAIKEALRPSWATDELWKFASDTLADKISYWDRHYQTDTMISVKSTSMEPYGGSDDSDEHKLSWNKVLNCLRYNCNHLMKVGMPEKRVDRLWLLEMNDAMGYDLAIPQLVSVADLSRSARGLGISFARYYSASLSGRFADRMSDGISSIGRLGYGWADNFSTYAELKDENTLVFHLPSGVSYSFSNVSGTWKPEDARDKTVLTETDDSYMLKYSSGTIQTFAKSIMKTSSIRDGQGNELTFTYSGMAIEKVQHSDGQFLSFTYSGHLLSQIADDQGRVTTYGYTRNLLTSVTSFNGLVTRYEYIADNGKPTNRALSKITYPDGSTREFAYDKNGRVVSTSVNGGQLKTQIVRGDFGCYSLVAPDGGVTDVTVGANGEVLKVVNALGKAVKLNRTADSLLESVVAPSGKRSKITYNKDGSPIAAMSASGATTAFSYTSEFDNLASVTDAKGHALNYSYDELGRSKAVSYVDGSSSTLEYNEKGDVVRSTNRRGETIEYEYDAEGNLVKKTWPNGRTFTIAYDAKGNVTNAADSVTGAVTMEYDTNERLTKIVYPKGRGFTYKYDSVGHIKERASLDGNKQSYLYDAFGRLLRVTGGVTAYLTNAYDPTTGRLVTQTYGNGTVVSNAYDAMGRTVGIYHLKGGKRLAFFAYEYDEDGKCISQKTAEGTESYTYDADGQLTSVTYPDGTSETFAYDAVGNRIRANNTNYTVNNLNQYTSLCDSASLREESFTYDLDGNLTSRMDADGTTTYSYDTLNRLVAVTNEAKNIRWSCEYDVFGNRVSVTDNGTTTERLFVQGALPSVAAEYQGNTLTKSHVLVGAVRLATHNSPTPNSPTLYYHSDLLGSARLLTDGTGATKGTSSFKAFGETRKSSGETTDAGYVGTLGVETDPNGLLFMRNRYYHAGMGRFVQMDPIGFKSEEIDLYRYCGNSPTFSVDMNGCEHITVCGHEIDRSVRRADYAPFGKDSSVFGDFAVTAYVYPNDINNNGFYCPYDPSSIYVWNGAPAQSLTAVHEYIHAWLTYKYPSIANTFEAEYLAWYLSRYYWYKKGRLPHMPSWREIVNSVDEAYNGRNHHWNIPMAAEIVEKIRRDVMSSLDPNEISGPLGTGEKRYVQQGEWMNYTIYFENKTNATAAAQEVFVDLPMDENLDWSTLELGEIAFGDHIDTSLSGKSHGKASYPLPGTNTFVKTTVTMKDGVLSWYMRDWDPTTADNFPTSATGGFLPPNDPETHCGEGHLSYRVRVKSNAPNGVVIRASAQIVFDSNQMIETDPSWWNTVATFHDVSLEIDGVTTNMTLIVGQPYGELPTPKSRTGYTFAGWYTGPNGTGRRVTAQSLVEAGDGGLYAHWAANAYKIAFNANGGKGEMPRQDAAYDVALNLASNLFTRTSYRFLGWAASADGPVAYADGAEIFNLTDVAGGVVTLYAVWEQKTVEVSFDAQGGAPAPTNCVFVVEAAYGELPEVGRDGYVFYGWFTEPDGKGRQIFSDTIVESGVEMLHAAWRRKTANVTFAAMGGTVSPASRTVPVGDAVGSLPVPVRDGYSFDGWFTAARGGVAVTAQTVVTGDLSFYAHWTEMPALYRTVDGVVPTDGASVWNGWIIKGEEIAGSIQVKVARPRTDRKTGTSVAKVTASVQMSGARKVSVRGDMDVTTGEMSANTRDGGELYLALGSGALSGTWRAGGGSDVCVIVGVRDVFSSRDKAEQVYANDLLSDWLGSVNVAWRGDSGWSGLAVTIAKKGKVRISGTLSDGTRVSATSQFLIGDRWCAVPVVWSKKATNLAFVLWIPLAGGESSVDGLDDAVFGKAGSLSAGAAFHVDRNAAIWSGLAGKVLVEQLPDGIPVSANGAKWVLPKAGKVAYVRGTEEIDEKKALDNPAGLKLTYTARTGSFKGSFKVYVNSNGRLKATTVNISGVVVDGCGYGTASIRKVGSVAVTVSDKKE